MSINTTKLRTPAARSTAMRAADGVIAGYIHSLARETARPAGETNEPALSRLVKHAYECGAGRRGMAARRRPALRRAPSPA